MKIDSSTTLQNLFEISKNTISDLKTNEVFIVKELFRGFEWNRISESSHVQLGSKFFNYANNDGSVHIEVLDKTLKNQQKYKKL